MVSIVLKDGDDTLSRQSFLFLSQFQLTHTTTLSLIADHSDRDDHRHGRPLDLRHARRLVGQAPQERQLLEGLREHSLRHTLPLLYQRYPQGDRCSLPNPYR